MGAASASLAFHALREPTAGQAARPALPALPACPPRSPRRRPRAPRANREAEHVRPSGGRHVCRRREPHRVLGRRRRRPPLRHGTDDRRGPEAAHRSRPATSSPDGPARDSALPPILFGSHIDSVPNGGNFDGDLGSLSALGVLEALAGGGRAHAASARNGGLGARRGIRLRPRPRLQPHRRRRLAAGGHGRGLERHAPRRCDPAASAATRIGFSRRGGRRARTTATSSCTSSRAARSSAPRVPVGVVEGIVAIDRYDAIVTGFANHAGTTPIAERHDAHARGRASHGRGARRRHTRARPPGRHGRAHRGDAEFAERHSRPGAPLDRAARPLARRSSSR